MCAATICKVLILTNLGFTNFPAWPSATGEARMDAVRDDPGPIGLRQHQS
jgi:hypothetical protein